MLAALVLSAAAQAAPAPAIHIERQRGTALTIEHTPARVVVRRGVRRAKVGLHRRASVRRKVVRARTAVARRKVRRTRLLVRGSEFVRNPAIAGGCYDGGFVRERVGGTRVTLQREVCEGIAPNLPKPELDSIVKILGLR